MSKPKAYQPIQAGHPPTQQQKDNEEIIATPLHVAASLDIVADIDTLLQAPENRSMLEARDSEGMTALMIAAKYGSDSALRALLGWGAKVSAQCPQGQTSLMYCLQQDQGSLDNIIQLVLADESSAHLDCQDQKGFSALHYAVSMSSSAPAALLRDSNAQVDLKDDYGSTPLYTAVRKNKETIAKELLKKANPAVLGWDGRSILHLACENGNVELLRGILSKWPNASPSQLDNMRDHQGNNPLHAACLSSRTKCAEFLLDFGMEVNRQGMMGWTPLHMALNTRDLATFQLLLSRNADWSIQSKDKLSVLSRLTPNEDVRYQSFRTALERKKIQS